jgi:VIT1/CCC1 family predicted Fe2+/Mn2+ transporter
MIGGIIKRAEVYIREIVFGLEDSLVSTLGVVTGVAVAVDESNVVIVTGCVLLVVEAVSMAASSYLSSKSELEIKTRNKKRKPGNYSPIISGIVMGGFYLFGGIFPMAPYIFLGVDDALVPSVVLTILALFGFGFVKAEYVGKHPLVSSIEMTVVSLSACAIGYAIGRLASLFFGFNVY